MPAPESPQKPAACRPMLGYICGGVPLQVLQDGPVAPGCDMASFLWSVPAH